MLVNCPNERALLPDAVRACRLNDVSANAGTLFGRFRGFKQQNLPLSVPPPPPSDRAPNVATPLSPRPAAWASPGPPCVPANFAPVVCTKNCCQFRMTQVLAARPDQQSQGSADVPQWQQTPICLYSPVVRDSWLQFPPGSSSSRKFHVGKTDFEMFVSEVFVLLQICAVSNCGLSSLPFSLSPFHR